MHDPERFVRDHLTWLMYTALGCFALALYLLGAVMPFLRRELGFSVTLAGLHSSVLAAGLMAAGALGDRVITRNRRCALTAGTMGMLTGLALLATSEAVLQSLVAAAFVGGFGGLVAIVVSAVLSDRHGERRPIALAEANLFASGCTIGAFSLVGFFAGNGPASWRASLLLPLAGTLAVSGLAARARLSTRPAERRTADEHRALPAAYWLYWAFLVMAVSVEFCLVFSGAEFLERVAGLDRDDAAIAMNVFVGAMVVGRWAGSRLARRGHIERLLAWMVVMSGAGFVVYWCAQGVGFRLAGLFVTGAGVANLFPLGLALALGAAGGAADLASARGFLASGVALLCSPLVLATISESFGIDRAQAVILLLLLVALVANLAGDRLGRRSRDPHCPAGDQKPTKGGF
jgi:predicted MFS family arabinose efflux permease